MGSLTIWTVLTEIRLRSIQRKLAEVSLEKSDMETESRIRNLSDSDLNADLSKNLGSDNKG